MPTTHDASPDAVPTQCPFCGRDTDTEAVTCDRYACDPSVTDVLDAFGTDCLYLRTNYKGRMQLYRDTHENPMRDELVWSDTRDDRVVALLERLGIDRYRNRVTTRTE